MAFLNSIIASRAELIHKFTYLDKNGELVFCYFLVKKEKQKDFAQKLAEKQKLSLEDYGEVIGKCQGKTPTEALISEMMARYGFSRDQLLPAFL